MQPIVLLSLPRSGSTLLQRCLAAHPEICSTSESWLLLPGAYALRQEGVVSEYGHSILQMGVSDFCTGLPEKQNDFYREYGDMVEMGILDPTKVTRSALQNAASVSGLMITTEAMVADEPKDDAPAMGGGDMGGMGGMGGMM